MAWSNIYCQIIGATGPVIGEGLLEGWWTSIELTGFSWDINSASDANKKTSFVEMMKRAAITASPVRGVKSSATGGKLTITKRFDIASSEIHLLMDQRLPIVSVSITVLHMKPGPASFHSPGFVILATDCKIDSVTESMEPGDKGVEIKESVEIDYEMMTITYLRPIMGQPIPMPPFIYKRQAASSTPSVPSL